MLFHWSLLLFIGALWGAIGITVTLAKQSKCQIPLFYFYGSLIAICIVSVEELCLSEIGDGLSAVKIPAVLCLVAGSLFNASGQALLMFNLKNGGRAFAYAIPQTALIYPFLWSVIVWHEKAGFFCWVGIICIAGSILFSAVKKNKTDDNAQLSRHRLFLAILSMLLLGISQIGIIMPSNFPVEKQLSASQGTWVILFASTLFFGLWSLFSGAFKTHAGAACFKWGCGWGVLAATSNMTLLTTLSEFRQHGQAGLVFPLACALSITIYSIYSNVALKERMRPPQFIGVAGLIAGILLTKLG